MDLPVELRVKVYGYVAENSLVETSLSLTRSYYTAAALLCTSKFINAEAKPEMIKVLRTRFAFAKGVDRALVCNVLERLGESETDIANTAYTGMREWLIDWLQISDETEESIMELIGECFEYCGYTHKDEKKVTTMRRNAKKMLRIMTGKGDEPW